MHNWLFFFLNKIIKKNWKKLLYIFIIIFISFEIEYVNCSDFNQNYLLFKF